MTDPAPRDRGGARAALWCCLGAGFTTLVDASVVAFTAPDVQATLGLSTAGVQWYLACFSLAFGLGLVPSGRLGDAFGRRVLFLGGLVLFLVGGVLSAAAFDGVLLVGGRLVQGFGAGFISAQVLGVIQDLYRGHERVRALAAYTAAGALAAVVGPVVTGIVLQTVPPDVAWRIVLLIPVLFAAATIVLGLRGLPRDTRTRRAVDLDVVGILALGALAVLVTRPVIDPGMPAPAIVAIVAVCGLLVAGLVWWERRYAGRGRLPLFAPALMRSRGFVTGNVVALLWFGSILAVGTITTVTFLDQGIPALVIALALVPSALARMLAARVAHRLFVRHGALIVGYATIAQTVFLAVLAGAALLWDGWALFAAAAVIQIAAGVASGIVEPPLRAVTLSFAPASVHGVAASFLQLTQRLSATFFVALATGLLLGAGGQATAESLRGAVLICVAASAVSAAAAFGRDFRRPPSPHVATG
ncbi:MFS transporter [Microbacterium sp. 18062]|uniref:MFS transporter n=1 Tax=Microbacterium sp. 18062 TaxID=2681410 RepID=UPI00135B81B0|nr:MFS transporter [Microbacterium sp. 18062]